MKKITILTIALWSVTNIFAFQSQLNPQIRMGERSTVEDYANNWLQDESSCSGALRNGDDPPTIGGEDPTNPNLSAPVGGGLVVLLALSGGYMLRRKKTALYYH